MSVISSWPPRPRLAAATQPHSPLWFGSAIDRVVDFCDKHVAARSRDGDSATVLEGISEMAAPSNRAVSRGAVGMTTDLPVNTLIW